MGYTQGVNFVVGYLLILGYNERDAFWMFAHLAMNKNHLLLGLYEDGFPLANIYTLIFKNILKKMDKQLHSHLYDSLMLDDSVWIFKWFITCYLYSFPLPVVKHIWDLIIELNGLALVYFAVALVIQLKDHLLTIDDPCDMAEFMQSLKTLSVFNSHIKIDRVVECTYEIHLTREDLSGIELLKPSFYQQYFNMMQSEFPEQQEVKHQGISSLPGHKNNKKMLPKLKSEKLRHHLHLWHIKLLEERL